jgi:hypothetical protein
MDVEWTDENTRIIVELFVKQVRKGNRPNTHLTPNGYEEVANEFKVITRQEYKQVQFIAACMTLHNYIRAHDRKDIHFERFDRDPNYVTVIPDCCSSWCFGFINFGGKQG